MGGISQIIGGLALVGFLLFLGGIGIAVAASSQNKPIRGGVILAVIGAIIGGVLTLVSQGIVVVETAQRVVVFQTLGGTLQDPLGPGTHIVIPGLQQATVYNVGQQNVTMGNEVGGSGDPITALTSDGQSVTFDLTVLYSVSTDSTLLNLLHQRWNVNYETNFIVPTVRNLAREAVSAYEARDIYGEKRAELGDVMQVRVAERFLAEGLVLTDLQIRDIQFSPEFANAIEQAQIAAQEVEQARLRVEQSEQVALQNEAIAQGEANSAIARAQGEAQAVLIRAQAEAQALALISTQLKANPLLIQYQWIVSLAPTVQTAIIPSNSPFLFDFNSMSDLPEADTNFTAPVVPTPQPTPTPRP
ncbi:MAG: prohibitin family protein [bacterium]|nr:prohibitin family protein [bacterium]